ncbi:MAG: sigma factor, ECF subfamily protein [Myxococcota bacterium]|nr:sigma factor, ECF subfamily protein [Myxococcota bacterium]
MELAEHFFRREAGPLVVALTRIFGVRNLALAEDVVQDAFCRAVEVWSVRGVPENPSAWLMTAAKNRALDRIRRERTALTFAPELSRHLESEWTLPPAVDAAFEAASIRDGQLRMMFSCCHPKLPEQAQLALILNILCGFGAPEIAAAFLTGRAAIEKRISRGKEALSAAKNLFDLACDDIEERLSTVQRALYLLFNEGYHGASSKTPVHADLCDEAIRLVALLREYPPAATPATDALAALMYLHAARLPAKLDISGDLSAMVDHDRSRWDAERIASGLELLRQSARGDLVTPYHVEAAIAAEHASARTIAETNWATIVSLYDKLIAITPSPVVALNRAIAIAERDGAKAGLAALRAIEDKERLAKYPFYRAACGELELRSNDRPAATAHFRAALAVARSEPERRFLERRIEAARAVGKA